MRRFLAVLAVFSIISCAHAEGLSPERLGVLYNLDDPSSPDMARFYAARRSIPPPNVMGLHLGYAKVLAPEALASVRTSTLELLPGAVQSLALVWSRPYAVGCMSITTAFAAGYRPEFCKPGCELTAPNPLFDSEGWLPADTVGWWPAMLIPTDDPARARAQIERGIASDATAPAGTVYLVRTPDRSRNVRAATYHDVEQMQGTPFHMAERSVPITQEAPAAIAYFTGAA